MPPSLNNAEVRSVAVVMLGLMGDVLMRTPLLRELKKAFPNALITCIVDPIGGELLRLNKNVDNLIVANRKVRRVRYLVEKIKLHLIVFTKRFEVLIDFYGGESSRRLVKTSFSKAWFIVSEGAIETNVQSGGLFVFPAPRNQHHLMNQSFDVLRFFDYPNKDSDNTPELHFKLKSLTPAGIIRDASISNFYLVSLGSGDLKKIIKKEMLVCLCKYLNNREKLFPKIICNPGQEFLQHDLADLLNITGIPNISLPALSVEELCENFGKARFVIAPDSGLFHLAVSLNVPVLGIFTHTNPLLVKTDRGIVEFCFKEKQENYGQVTLPEGSNEINSRLIIRKAKNLLRRTKAV